jgi:Histidine kinase
MSITKLYLNFWVRNVTLYLFFLTLVLTIDAYTATPEELKEPVPGIRDFIIISLLVFIQIGIHNLLLYEKLLKKRKIKKYVAGFLLLWFAGVLINTYTPYSMGSPKDGFGVNIPTTLFIFILGFGVYSIHENIIKKNILFRSELVSREEEIRYLKAQLNPHFLFNALNNLYGVALSKPGDTADKILELSDLLRYQIEASQKEMVLLKDEIDYLEKYFSYELNRTPRLTINFKKEGDENNILIAPLLFMPFIENAFKFSNETDKPVIDLTLLIKSNRVLFKLSNNYFSNGKKLNGTNTGIANTKKRLEMVYENNHMLNINHDHNLYSVQLTLDI